MEHNDTTTISPLPYHYDAEDERINALITQVATFCGKEFTEVVEGDAASAAKLREEKEAYWTALWQVIRFISNITCWTEQADDTFIMQTRVQYFDVAQVCGCRPGCCHCDENVVEIPLDFAPVQGEEPFVSGKLTVFVNGKPKTKEISAEYLNEHYDEASGKVYLDRSDFDDMLMFRGKCCCLCRRNVKIQLKYNAGYTALPVGLLTVICPLMTKIEESKSGLNECANAMTQVSGALRFKKVGNIQYQWSDTESNSQKTYSLYTDLYNLATVDEVYALSRCMIAETPEEMGDVI